MNGKSMKRVEVNLGVGATTVHILGQELARKDPHIYLGKKLNLGMYLSAIISIYDYVNYG